MHTFSILPVSCFMENSSCGFGRLKQWASCPEVEHFEMTKIIQPSSPGLFSSASSSSAPIEGAQQGHFSLRTPRSGSSMHASTSLPKHPKEEQIFRDSKKDKPRSKMSLFRNVLRNAAHVALLRNTTSQYRLLLPLSTDKDFPGTLLANTFSWTQASALLVPFPKESWRVFFSFPPPHFLSRGQPSPQTGSKTGITGCQQCHLVRGPGQEWDEASLLPAPYSLVMGIPKDEEQWEVEGSFKRKRHLKTENIFFFPCNSAGHTSR